MFVVNTNQKYLEKIALCRIMDKKDTERSMEEKVQGKLPVVTISLIAVNVAVWIVMELIGDTQDGLFMAEHGASLLPRIIDQGEYWRIFTCMFLHFGADHLINNMLMLGLLGMRLEHTLGSFLFAMLYFLSGLCGNLLSLYDEMQTGSYVVSAGASGAVFGIIGGLIAWAVLHRGRVEGLSTRGLFFMAALSLYYGFTTAGVDNLGHIGGLAGGFVLGMIFAIASKFIDSREQ